MVRRARKERHMSKKSLKKEQTALLRFEKELIGLGAGLGVLTAGAGASAQNVVGDMAAEQAEAIQSAYLNLVETVQAAHYAMESSAAAAGAQLLHASGTPKNATLMEMAKSALGIG